MLWGTPERIGGSIWVYFIYSGHCAAIKTILEGTKKMSDCVLLSLPVLVRLICFLVLYGYFGALRITTERQNLKISIFGGTVQPKSNDFGPF